MNIKQKLKNIYLNSNLEQFIEKVEMRKLGDEEKAEIVENVIEERPTKAIRYAKEIEDPETKINTLEDIVSNIPDDHVVEILNTLPNEEMSRVIGTDEIVETLINGYYKNEIIEVLKYADTEKERLQGIYTFIESLNDLEISVLLKNTDNEEMKKKIITRKIIENYKKYGNVLHVNDLIKPLNKKEDIIEVVEKSVDKIDEELKENESFFDGKVKNGIRSKFFYYAYDQEDKANEQRLEKMKLDKIDEYYKKGELNYGGLYQLINRGLRNKHMKAIAIEKYRGVLAQHKDIATGKIIQEPLLSEKQLETLYNTLEERDKFILKYSNGKMLVNERNSNFFNNAQPKKEIEEMER